MDEVKNDQTTEQTEDESQVTELIKKIREFRTGVIEHLKDKDERLYVIDLDSGLQSVTDVDINGSQYLIFSQLKEKVDGRYPTPEDIHSNTVGIKFVSTDEIKRFELLLAALKSRMIANAADVTVASTFEESEKEKQVEDDGKIHGEK